jgi:hypothetical protein
MHLGYTVGEKHEGYGWTDGQIAAWKIVDRSVVGNQDRENVSRKQKILNVEPVCKLLIRKQRTLALSQQERL